MAFGVTTDNIFSLLDEENEDPQALATKAIAAQEPKAKKDAAAKPKDAAKPAGRLPGSPRKIFSGTLYDVDFDLQKLV